MTQPTVHRPGWRVRPALLGPLALALLLLAPFAGLLLRPDGRVLGNPRCDNPSTHYFINHFASRSWREGEAPFWNPYIMLGYPFLGEGQAAVFHPMSLLFVLLPTGRAVNWHMALTFLLTGLLFRGWLRAVGIGERAAFCGAIVWAFSSVPIARMHAGHLNIFLTFISLPAILMLWERYRASGRLLNLAGVSVAYACLILAAYPQATYAFSTFILLYALIPSAFACRSRKSGCDSRGRLPHAGKEMRAILALGFFLLLGTGMGMLQLLPSLDFVSESFRRRSSIEFCGRFSFTPENLLTLLCPYFFGVMNQPGPDVYWGRNYLWENWLYVGVLPLLAAFAGAVAAPRTRRVQLVACGGLFLVVALGKHTPLFPLLYRHVPLFDAFRGPSKYILVAHFCLVALAAFGFDRWFCRLDTREKGARADNADPAFRTALVVGLVLLLAAVALYALLIPGHETPGSRWQSLLKWRCQAGDLYTLPIDADDPAALAQTGKRAAGQLTRAMILLLAALAVLVLPKWRRVGPGALLAAVLLATCVDLGTFFRTYWKTFDESIATYPEAFTTVLSQTPYPARVFDTASEPNLAMRHGFSSVGGYSGNTLPRFNHFVNRTQGYPLETSQALTRFRSLPPLYRFLGIEYLVLPADWPDPGLKIVARGGERALYERPDGFPRAFLAAAPVVLPDPEAALEYVASPEADLFGSPAVENLETALDPAPLHPEERIRLASFRRNRVELEVEATRRRLLILNEMFYKDWRARVNGRPAKIHPANYLFRGVVVPGGQSTVVFEYRPVSFWIGLLISAISLLCLAVVSAILASRRNDAKRAGAEEAASAAPVAGPSRS